MAHPFLAFQVLRLYNELDESGTRALATTSYNLPSRVTSIMVYLKHQGPSSITSLASAIGVSHQLLSQRMNFLYDESLVRKSEDPADRRRTLNQLTAEGYVAAAEIEDVCKAGDEAFQVLFEGNRNGCICLRDEGTNGAKRTAAGSPHQGRQVEESSLTEGNLKSRFRSPSMIRQVLLMIVVASCYACTDDSPDFASAGIAGTGPFSEHELLEAVEASREHFGSPALGVLIQSGDDEPLIAVSGVRQLGKDVRAEENDLWLIGSVAKSMTATLLATFVQSGKVSFETTLPEIFPELSEQFTDQTRLITLEQLLNHTSGLPPNPADSPGEFAALIGNVQDPSAQRQQLLLKAISGDLSFSPGSDYAYSNTGYILAGSVIEKLGSSSYELLLDERVFKPLGIQEFGFGHPAGRSETDRNRQPWGHRSSFSD